MPEIDRVTGNYIETQQADLLQATRDRFFTILGTRAAIPEYGFPLDRWTQLPRPQLESAIRQTLETDALIDRVDVDYLPGGVVEVVVNSLIRVRF